LTPFLLIAIERIIPDADFREEYTCLVGGWHIGMYGLVDLLNRAVGCTVSSFS